MKKTLGSALLALVALSTTSFAYAGTFTYYRLFANSESLRSLDINQPPHAFHVKGTISNNGPIQWSSKVEGKGKLCSDGRDILDLSSGVTYAAADGARPAGPYVLGCKSGSLFTPSSLEVQNR